MWIWMCVWMFSCRGAPWLSVWLTALFVFALSSHSYILTIHNSHKPSQAEVTADQINALLAATGNEVEGFYPIIFANYLSNPESIQALITSPGGSGGGGGAGGAGGADGGAAEEEEEEEEVEEEAGMEDAIDMFGGDEGGDY